MVQTTNTQEALNINARVFEDNFNVLSQIINNYPTTNYTEGNLGDNEIDNSLSISNDQQREKKPMTESFKYYLLIQFSCIYLVYGCQNSLFGPTMSDLATILNTTSEKISIAISIKSFMYIISTILVSVSFKLFGNRQLQYGFAVLLIGFLTGLTPFMTSFTQYLIGSLFNGFSSAFIDSVTNLVVLELFSLNSKIYMQIAHSAFTFGTIFGPLLVAPFLSKAISNSTTSSNNSNHSDITTTLAPFTTTLFTPTDNETTTTISRLIEGLNNFELSFNDSNSNRTETDSRIYIPYSIIAFLLILSAILMITSQIVYPYIPEKRKLFAKQKSKRVVEPLEEQFQDSQTPSNSQENSQDIGALSNSSSNKKSKTETVCQHINLPKAYYRTFLGLTGLLLSIYTCIDYMTGMFLPSFLAKSELKIEKDEAAFMSSIVYMTMASGRIFTIIFALKTTCKILLFFNLSMILCGYITLTFFAVHSKFITWIAMIVIGFGLSSTYPLILSYIENRIVITNTIQLYLLFASFVILVFMPIVIGHFIDTAPMIFAYINLTLAICALILMLLIHASDVWKRKLIRNMKEDQQNIVDSMEEI